MKKNQIISLGTCMCLLLNTSVLAKGIEETEVKNNEISHSTSNKVSANGYNFESVSQTKNYSKDKITNQKTNKTELLEQFIEKDSKGNILKSIAITDENGEKTFIQKKGNNFVVIKNNVVLHEVPAEEPKTEGISNLKLSSVSLASYGPWYGPLITETHTNFYVGATVSVVIGLLMLATYPEDAKVSSVIFGTIANAIVMEFIRDVYIRLETYTRVDQVNSIYQSKITGTYYRYSNYTGYIGSVAPQTWEYNYSGL